MAAVVLLKRLLFSFCRFKFLHFISLVNEKREQEPLPSPLLPVVPVSQRKAADCFPGSSEV